MNVYVPLKKAFLNSISKDYDTDGVEFYLPHKWIQRGEQYSWPGTRFIINIKRKHPMIHDFNSLDGMFERVFERVASKHSSVCEFIHERAVDDAAIAVLES